MFRNLKPDESDHLKMFHILNLNVILTVLMVFLLSLYLTRPQLSGSDVGLMKDGVDDVIF